VKFVRDTHYCFTAGKDGVVKYWNCDSFELVTEFKEAFGDVWALAVSSIGDFFVAGGNDRNLRFYL
jgi:U3 small nucleolar RNA-associated protein 12